MLLRGGSCIAAVLLSACSAAVPDSATPTKRTAPAFGGLFSSLSESKKNDKPLSKVSMVGGDIVLSGPDGYCIDSSSLINKSRRGFALLASCRIQTNGMAGPNVEPALITVTITTREDQDSAPTPEALAASADAQFLSGKTYDGISIAHLGSGGDQVLKDGAPRHWRAAFSLNDHLVGLALYPPKDGSLAGPSGNQMMSDLVTKIKRLSPSLATQKTASGTEEAPARKFELFGLLKRRDSQ